MLMLLIVLLIVVVVAVWSFVLGLQAWRSARRRPEQRASLQLLALLLCEPLVNGALMTLIFLGQSAWSASGARTAMMLTAPMLVLLVTLGGLAEPNPAVRERNRGIAALAVGRWAATLLSLLALFYGVVAPLLPLVLLGMAAALLCYSAYWGRHEVREAVLA